MVPGPGSDSVSPLGLRKVRPPPPFAVPSLRLLRARGRTRGSPSVRGRCRAGRSRTTGSGRFPLGRRCRQKESASREPAGASRTYGSWCVRSSRSVGTWVNAGLIRPSHECLPIDTRAPQHEQLDYRVAVNPHDAERRASLVPTLHQSAKLSRGAVPLTDLIDQRVPDFIVRTTHANESAASSLTLLAPSVGAEGAGHSR